MKLFLTRRDLAITGIATGGHALAGLGLTALLGPEAAYPLVGSLAVAFTLGAGHYTFRRHQVLSFYDKSPSDNYKQIEALFNLFSVLDWPLPLPQMRHWVISPDAACGVIREVLVHEARTIVECGSGVSTMLLARCLQKAGEGHVWSLEQNAEQAERTRELLRVYGVADWATVLGAPLTHIEIAGERFDWYAPDAVAELPEGIDLLFVDGPGLPGHELSRYPALPVLRSRLSPDAVIALDDLVRPREQRAMERWLEELSDYAGESIATEKGLGILRPRNPSGAAAPPAP